MRRAAVLESALATFARYGYRRTSMEEIARAAHISRPGLYFLFSSKEALFRAAVERGLQRDIDAASAALAAIEEALHERLLTAFDAWAGRYVGPLAHDTTAVIADNPGLLGATAPTMSARFEALIVEAVMTEAGPDCAHAVARTLISTSVGLKHQVAERSAYRDRMRDAIALIVP